MRPETVVEVWIPNRHPSFRHVVVNLQVNLFVFHRSPKPFDEEVVAPGSLPIHADRDLVLQKKSGERFTGKLTSPTGIEDFRRAMPRRRFLPGLEAKSASIVCRVASHVVLLPGVSLEMWA